MLAVYLSGKAPNTLKLTHKTNILPPPLPQIYSKRALLVESFTTKLNSSTLLHIQGEIGQGKTQLCNLVISSLQDKVYWFRIREYKKQLKTFIIELNNLINNSQGYKLLKLFSKDLRIESSSILVLDDLPNLTEINIEDDFIELVLTCEKYKIKILSSSNYILPERVNQYSRLIESVHIPLFTDEETMELLHSYQAPENIKNYTRLINIFSDSHPKLIIPTINYLQSNDWKVDFDDFFKNKFIEHELLNFQVFLEQTIKDTQTKELLYRLNNIGKTVTEEEIQVVSNVEPKIEHPFAKLGALLNIWMFKETEKEYLLSPLIYKLGSKNLDKKVKKNINLELGHYIFSKGEVNSYEISKGIAYYIQAKETNMAAFRLFQALHSAIYIADISEDDMFHLHSFWVHTNLPEEIEIGMQLLLRTVQIILHKKFGNDVEKLYEDYLKIELEVISTKNPNPYALILSYMLFSSQNYKAFEFGLKLSEKMNNYSISERKKIGFPIEVEGIPIDAVFIFNFELLTSLDELKKWILAIKKVDTIKLKQLFDSKLGIESIQPLEHMIAIKLIKGAQSLQLEEIFTQLIDLSEYMHAHSITNCWASLISSAVKCLIEEDKLDEAYIIVQDALIKADDDAKLILTYYLAMRYVDKKEYDKALDLYIKVIDIEETLYEATLVDALTYAPIAFAFTGEYTKAKIYIEKALLIYKNTKNYDELLLSRIYGEYSIVLWELNLKHQCLIACEEALFLVEKNCDLKNKGWKVTEVVLGHCLGYYSLVLMSGKVPEITESGDEYARPQNRFYLYTSDDTYTIYDENKRFLLYYNLYGAFYQLNEKNRGIVYLHKSFELSKNSTLNDFKIFLYKDIYLVENNFVEYFRYVKSFYGHLQQETVVHLLILPLIKLITELINSRNKVEDYKTAFVNSFAEILDKQFLDVMLYTLDVLNGIKTSLKIESNGLTQRIYVLSEVQSSTVKRALEVHKVFYNDYFIDDNFQNSNVIKIEVLENYFFKFWLQKINTKKSSFLYADNLLERLTENYNTMENPKNKVLELLTLVDRYVKK